VSLLKSLALYELPEVVLSNRLLETAVRQRGIPGGISGLFQCAYDI
jgi:hypothetical protein